MADTDIGAEGVGFSVFSILEMLGKDEAFFENNNETAELDVS